MFHMIDDAVVITYSRGVYKQAKVYRKGKTLFAGHGSGFIRMMKNGTSAPNVSISDIFGVNFKYDKLGNMEIIE